MQIYHLCFTPNFVYKCVPPTREYTRVYGYTFWYNKCSVSPIYIEKHLVSYFLPISSKTGPNFWYNKCSVSPICTEKHLVSDFLPFSSKTGPNFWYNKCPVSPICTEKHLVSDFLPISSKTGPIFGTTNAQCRQFTLKNT